MKVWKMISWKPLSGKQTQPTSLFVSMVASAFEANHSKQTFGNA